MSSTSLRKDRSVTNKPVQSNFISTGSAQVLMMVRTIKSLVRLISLENQMVTADIRWNLEYRTHWTLNTKHAFLVCNDQRARNEGKSCYPADIYIFTDDHERSGCLSSSLFIQLGNCALENKTGTGLRTFNVWFSGMYFNTLRSASYPVDKIMKTFMRLSVETYSVWEVRMWQLTRIFFAHYSKLSEGMHNHFIWAPL